MRFRFLILLSSCFFLSCTTVATKNRPSKPAFRPPVQQKGVKGKALTGLAAKQAANLSENSEDPAARVQAGLDYLKLLVQDSVQNSSKDAQEKSRAYAIEIVENKLNDEQLERVAESSDYGYLRGHALYRLGYEAFERRETSLAKKYFNSVIEFVPGSDLAGRSLEILSQLEASRSVSPQTVGVVLPLTGRNATVGQRALRGLEMGLGLHLPGSTLKLAIMDSEGNPDSARRGVERLVREDNVIAIVGSLLSKTAPAVAAKSDEMGVPSIALSQRNGLTEIGTHVFRNSLTSAMQIRTLVRTAMDEQGLKKFAILFPNDPYGVEFSNIFWDEVLARGGEVTAVQTYSPKETDFRLVVQRLVGTFYGEARQDEFNLRMKELQQADKKKSVRNSNLENVLPPVADFDAIFIPDSVKAMGQISAMLSYNDVRDVALMGTNLWNTKDVVRRAGSFAEKLLFVDSVTPTVQGQSRFMADYKAVYNESPTLIEIQAYDAGLVLRQLIASGVSTREGLTERLAELRNFPGAVGALTTNAEREIERPVMALTALKGEIIPAKKKQ